MRVIGILVLIAFGFWLHPLRYRFSFVYGVCELVVAVAVISLAFYPPVLFLVADNASLWGTRVARLIALLAGANIVRSGLDNIRAGLSEQSRATWDWVFRRPPDRAA
jgi:hypothetical protein